MYYMSGDWYIYPTGNRLTIAGPSMCGHMDLDTFDELVVMHYHKMSAAARSAAERRVIDKQAAAGPGGAQGLDQIEAEQIRQNIRQGYGDQL